jgi:hypothetical protein
MFGAENPKPSRRGSVTGAPLEMAAGDDGRGWWGGFYKVRVVAGCCGWSRKRGRQVLGLKLETEPLGLGFGSAGENSGGERWEEVVSYGIYRGCGGCSGRLMAQAGVGVWAQNSKPSRWGLVSGAPMKKGGREWWDKVVG